MTTTTTTEVEVDQKPRPCGRCNKTMVVLSPHLVQSLVDWNRRAHARGEKPIAYSEVLRCRPCYLDERAMADTVSQSDLQRVRAVIARLKANLLVDQQEMVHAMGCQWSDILRHFLASTKRLLPAQDERLPREPGQEG